MALQFCEHPDVVFDDAPLVMVLCQVRFPPVLSLMTLAGVTGFQTAIRDIYPTLLPASRMATVEVSNEQIGASATAPVWKFADESKNWTVGLATDFVSLETPRYSDIGEFLSRFQRILKLLRHTVRPADALRIGFRKVNVFHADGHDTVAFSEMITPELLGPLGVQRFPTELAGCFGQIVFKDDDNALVVRHGLAEPKEENKMEYVVDMDYFTERPMQVDGNQAMIELLRYFSDGMTSFFHWAVRDAHKEKLGPHERKVRGAHQ